MNGSANPQTNGDDHRRTEGYRQMTELARKLVRHGFDEAAYFLGLCSEDVCSQRRTKDTLPERVKRSRDKPQIVTVQSRGDEMGGEYAIVPVKRLNEALAATLEKLELTDECHVPITQKLCAIGDDRSIRAPKVTPRRRGGGRRPKVTVPHDG